MKLFENICLAGVTLSVMFLMIESGRFVHKQSRQASDVLKSANDTIQSANALLKKTDSMEDTVFSTAGQFSSQLSAQSADWQKSQLQFYKTITDTKEILVRTDRSLNDVLAPRLAASLDASTRLQDTAAANITATTLKIDATIDELRPAIDNGIRATSAAAAAMSDPAVHETLTHVDGAAGNLDATSGDVRAFVHRETTPVRGAWNTVKAFLMEFAGPAAQVATAAK